MISIPTITLALSSVFLFTSSSLSAQCCETPDPGCRTKERQCANPDPACLEQDKQTKRHKQTKQGKQEPKSASTASKKTSPNVLRVRTAMAPVYRAYLKLQSELAGDDLRRAQLALGQLASATKGSGGNAWSKDLRGDWRTLEVAVGKGGKESSIRALRKRFADISKAVLGLHERVGHAGSDVFVHIHCSMAFDGGADWLQVGKKTRNPYFGKRMLGCGAVRASLAGNPIHSANFHTADAVTGVYDEYLLLQARLAGDDLDGAKASVKKLRGAVGMLAKHNSSGKAAGAPGRLQSSLERAGKAKSIESLRSSFAEVSQEMLSLHEEYGHSGSRKLYRLHCPMALGGRGASWLQGDRKVANPYLGAKMPRCGSVKEELVAPKKR